MDIFIDGYNLLYASGVFGSGGRTALEGSREALLDWLAEVLTVRQCKRTTIVFDAQDAPPGLPDRARKHGLRIRFARRGQEADEVLEELIRQHSSPRRLTVVSSDHRVQRAARRRRATAIDSDQWVSQARRPADEVPPPADDDPRQSGLEKDEVEAWLKMFRM